MKIFVIFAAVVACSYAAPMSELLHPSPINPNVLVELKPAEKIILITDPQEMAKFKRETQQPLYPTVLPPEENHQRAKRSTSEQPINPLSIQKSQPPSKSSINKRNRREVEPVKITQTLPATSAGHIVVEVYQKPLVLPATEDPIPQILEAPDQKPIENDTKQETSEVTTEKAPRPQGLPAIFSPSKKQKRDVLLPSVPTHHSSEEAPKDINSGKFLNEYKTEQIETHNKDLKTQNKHKRDIPVSLVPKHHHPEESPKEDYDKENKEAKKEANLVTNHDVQKNPQVLSAVLKESHIEAHKHKSDVPVPLAPKHYNLQEFMKDEKEELNSKSHHIQKQSSQKPQVLSTIQKESEIQQQNPVSLESEHDKPQESLNEDNKTEHHNNDKKVNLKTQYELEKLPAHGEKDVTHKEFQKPQEPSVEITQHKRDIPVPLIPKHHNLDESPKNVEQGNHDDTTKSNSEIRDTQNSFQQPQAPAGNLEETSVGTPHKPEQTSNDGNIMTSYGEKKEFHVHEEIQKPQRQPITVFSNDQQQKHETTVPVVENQNRHDEIENLHNLPQAHHLPQTLPVHNYHIEKNHQHIFPPSQTSPDNVATIPIIHKFQPKTHNQYALHLHQRLAAPNYEHVTQDSVKTTQDQSVDNKEHVGPININKFQVLPVNNTKHEVSTNFQNSQILSTNNEEHVTPINNAKHQILPNFTSHKEVLQKPEAMQAVEKYTTESTAQKKRYALTSIKTLEQVHKHKDEEESEESKTYSKSDEVEEKNLSEPKPLLQPNLQHIQLAHSEHKPNIWDDHLSAHDLPSSTTEHSAARHRPVPVAELFARAHDN